MILILTMYSWEKVKISYTANTHKEVEIQRLSMQGLSRQKQDPIRKILKAKKV
jgi:hypothetical protein